MWLLFTLDAGLLAISQYSEGPATGYLKTGFSWFPCVYKQMLRWFPSFQVATTCFSCSPPDLNLLDPYFIFMYIHNSHRHRVTAHLQLNILLLLLWYFIYYYYCAYVLCFPFIKCTYVLCFVIGHYAVDLAVNKIDLKWTAICHISTNWG